MRGGVEHPGPGNLPPPGSIHPHMLRHACGFKLANDGHDTRALQHYLGHKHIQHTVRYTEMARGPVQEFLALTGAGKLGTTFGRCVFQCADAPPKSCLISCKEIGHGRNVGQSFRAHCGRHWRNLPALICSIEEGKVSNMICTCPPTKSIRAGPARR